MTILSIIDKKVNKKELTSEEISFFIKGYLNSSIKDYQVSSLLMAIPASTKSCICNTPLIILFLSVITRC